MRASSFVNQPSKELDCGADDFLSKPVNKQELLARVKSLLRLKQFTDELENAETVLFSLAYRSQGSRHPSGAWSRPSGTSGR